MSKVIYPTSRPIFDDGWIDSPLSRRVMETTEYLMDKLGVGVHYDIDARSVSEICRTEWLKNSKEEKNMAYEIMFLGKTYTNVTDGETNSTVRIKGEYKVAKVGNIVLHDDCLYVFQEDSNPMKRPSWKKIASMVFDPEVAYNNIQKGWLGIKNVVFNDPATIVFWNDGTKTVVKCGENDKFDPEKGLVMAIAKKAFGNQGNYFNKIKTWLPKADTTIEEAETEDQAQKYVDSARDLIADMAFNGATKSELVRAIRFSKELIDKFKEPADPSFNPMKLEKDYGIEILRDKYQK